MGCRRGRGKQIAPSGKEGEQVVSTADAPELFSIRVPIQIIPVRNWIVQLHELRRDVGEVIGEGRQGAVIVYSEARDHGHYYSEGWIVLSFI